MLRATLLNQSRVFLIKVFLILFGRLWHAFTLLLRRVCCSVSPLRRVVAVVKVLASKKEALDAAEAKMADVNAEEAKHTDVP